MNERAPLTIKQQAFLLEDIVRRCKMWDGSFAGETVLTLSKQDAEDLDALAIRLERMAPHEREIRRVVMGK